MAEDRHGGAEGVAPSNQLIQMASAYWVSCVVYAAAKLGLADHLDGHRKTAAELAGPTHTHAPTLHRLMRTMASLGILTEDQEHRFALTSLGKALKSGVPGSARASVLTIAGQWWWQAWEHFLYCVETGNTGMQKASGMPVFDFLARNPDESALFNETMIGFHGSEPTAVAAAYDFSGSGTIVDIGGGTGNLLAAILERYPETRGLLADRPHVVEQAPNLVKTRRLGDRVAFEAIDFFKAVPAGGDIYVLSHVIHDWHEDQCITILSNCRKVIKNSGKLLIVEMVLPGGDVPHPGKVLDMVMLVMTGGQERTEEEYRSLLEKSGFRLTRTVPTASAVSVVEAVPV